MTTAATRFVIALREAGDGRNAASNNRLCDACVRVLPVAQAAITLAMPGGRWEVLGAAGDTAARFADAQAATGEGPGPDAHAAGASVRVRDFAEMIAAGRWPLLAQWNRFTVTSPLCSLPLRVGAIRVGFLDLLGADRVVRDVEAYSDATQVATVITTILLTTPVDDAVGFTDRELGPWWEQSLAAREIHQATGMIAVQLDCSAAVAYSRLVGYAFSTERTLADVAADVVARRLRFPPDAQPDRHRRAEPDPI
ncbi:ANTAR domain-containing protein [Nocardia wallacei]|uniref:ANTAR domain-containing protein n=1 Tax=Nocardia wallacei TaxID=480035 RepID=UPI00245375B8|nr:ANTAR domain-containing protein [Nocardia wallacei]